MVALRLELHATTQMPHTHALFQVNTSGTEQRASLTDRHELFTPSYKRGNERDIEKETVRERDGDGA